MNSFNHYSLGSCGEYLFGGIGGIRPASPGYKTILIQPVIRNGLTWAKTAYNSIHGTIATEWKRKGNRIALKVVVPANTTATVCLPAASVAQVTESGRPVTESQTVKLLRLENNAIYVEVGSGTYKFGSEMN